MAFIPIFVPINMTGINTQNPHVGLNIEVELQVIYKFGLSSKK